MLKKILKNLIKRCGYELLGRGRSHAAHRSIAALIQQEQINLVLDVGANMGQFVDELRELGYHGRVISFEPLSSAHNKLKEHAAKDANWTVWDRTAIGTQAGSVEIYIAGNSASSSILGMLPSHSEMAPESRYVGVETTQVSALDDLYTPLPTDRVLLKIDTQGYEKQVLEGAQRLLKDCRVIMTEMSFVPLYANQIMAKELWNLLENQGFEVWALEPCVRHPRTQRLMQVDGVFVHRAENI